MRIADLKKTAGSLQRAAGSIKTEGFLSVVSCPWSVVIKRGAGARRKKGGRRQLAAGRKELGTRNRGDSRLRSEVSIGHPSTSSGQVGHGAWGKR